MCLLKELCVRALPPATAQGGAHLPEEAVAFLLPLSIMLDLSDLSSCFLGNPRCSRDMQTYLKRQEDSPSGPPLDNSKVN